MGTNGNRIESKLLGSAKTANYKPTAFASAAWSGPEGWGKFDLTVVDQMRRDWQVNQALAFKAAPLHTAEFEYKASDSRAMAFAQETMQRFWQKSLSMALECMPFGYAGSEPLYKDEGGLVKFDHLKPLHPRDILPYTADGKLQWVRVKSIGIQSDFTSVDPDAAVKGGVIDLPSATRDFPTKGYWSTFEPKYSQWFGRPLLLPAWWPWRLKTMPDGAMENAFKAFYKHGFLGMIIRHPDEVYQDSTTSAPISAQDYARQLSEQIKSGASIALSSRRDDKGHPAWEIEKYGGEAVGNFEQLLTYPDWLDRLIVRGMAIPDEIITHDGATGGFSRSNIAWLAFLIMEEEILNHQLEIFCDQILNPLLRLNFGEAAWVKVKPKPLLPDPQQSGQQQSPHPGASQTNAGQNPYGNLPKLGDSQNKPPVPGQNPSQVQMSARHAPHTMTIAGKEYRGGEFIPADEWEKATEEEKEKVEKGHAEKERPAKKPIGSFGGKVHEVTNISGGKGRFDDCKTTEEMAAKLRKGESLHKVKYGDHEARIEVRKAVQSGSVWGTTRNGIVAIAEIKPDAKPVRVENSDAETKPEKPTTLSDLSPGELGHVDGMKVRRVSDSEWRIETPTGHIQGDETVIKQAIERQKVSDKADKSRADKAIKRVEEWNEPDFFNEPERAEAETKAFEELPKGTRIVSLDDKTKGRLGTIVHDSLEIGGKVRRVNRVQLDGEDGFSSSHVEPLDQKLSWRKAEEAGDQWFVEFTLRTGGKNRLGPFSSKDTADKVAAEWQDDSDGKGYPDSKVVSGNHDGKKKEKQETFFSQPTPDGDWSKWTAVSMSVKEGKGQWITIGAHPGEDGKKHGGTPVYIENGRITKGAPGLHGKKIDALKEGGEEKPKEPQAPWRHPGKHPGTMKPEEFLKHSEYAKQLHSQYFDEDGKPLAKSREDKANPINIPVGTWKIEDQFKGSYGRGIEQLREFKPEELKSLLKSEDLVETNTQGRKWDSERYAEWMKEGHEPPPVEIVETDKGQLKVSNGHRRLAAAIMANKPLKAWVSPVHPGDWKDPQGNPIMVGLTHELAQKHLQESKQAEKPSEETTIGSHRQQLNQSKDYSRAVWGKKARKEGIEPKHLHQLAAEILAHDSAFKEQHTKVLQDARQFSTKLGYGGISAQSKAFREGDPDQVKGLDEISGLLADRYPDVFAGSDPEHKLYEMLAQGNPEKMSEEQAYEEAFNHLAEHKPEEIPFSHPANEPGFLKRFAAKFWGTLLGE